MMELKCVYGLSINSCPICRIVTFIETKATAKVIKAKTYLIWPTSVFFVSLTRFPIVKQSKITKHDKRSKL